MLPANAAVSDDGAAFLPLSAIGRKILHVDMDAFYASVEQRDNPALRGKPVVVGSAAPRGVVAAASYEARTFGVRSAMPSVTAMRRCPDLIFVPHRFDVYRAVSAQIRAIFAEHTTLIEPLSLDEAYLDVTVNHHGIPLAAQVARTIRAAIRAETGLTASAGVSYNKFLAKMASDLNKPNGQAVITPAQGPGFVATLPVHKFHGIGPATAARMERLGIRTGADLRARSLPFLQEHFGKSGPWYYRISRGIDERPVQPHRTRKSIGAEDTFAEDITDHARAAIELRALVAKVWRQCAAKGVRGRTVTLKAKYANFRQITRSRTLMAPVSGPVMEETALALLQPLFPVEMGIRLLGVTLSSLEAETPDSGAAQQLSLWETAPEAENAPPNHDTSTTSKSGK
ncbi:MAG: DNA polymerase IV [Pararhodobacter sp.]|nr:DNA polymerase IV [Pararhodobacter sp.]